MKKHVSGLLAVIIALSATAFTTPHKNVLDPVYDWLIYDAGGHSTGMFLEDKTEAQVRAANTQCNGSTTTCFEAYDQTKTVPQGVLIKKP